MSSPQIFPRCSTPISPLTGANRAQEGALLRGRHRLRGDGHREFPAGQQRAAATGREEPGTGAMRHAVPAMWSQGGMSEKMDFMDLHGKS